MRLVEVRHLKDVFCYSSFLVIDDVRWCCFSNQIFPFQNLVHVWRLYTIPSLNDWYFRFESTYLLHLTIKAFCGLLGARQSNAFPDSTFCKVVCASVIFKQIIVSCRLLHRCTFLKSKNHVPNQTRSNFLHQSPYWSFKSIRADAKLQSRKMPSTFGFRDDQ